MIPKFLSRSPSLPYLYGLIKTHKPNNPARPIISSVGSVAYRLSKWLVQVLSPVVGSISNSHITNNLDLVNKLSSLKLNYDFKLVSFDVTALFTRVPVDDLLSFLRDLLPRYNLTLPTNTIIELIKLCIKDNYFSFNDSFYKQTFGMAMGNPLSPVLSNLYMECFETNILPRILPSNLLWYRYVDDILCLWPVNHDETDFLNQINSLVPSIKFTIENEVNGVLPFLDIMIHRIGRSFKFNVYRKPTNVCSYVHFYSNHHVQVKRAVFSGMFLRALRVCSPEFFDEEIANIFEIGKKLKYPKSILDLAFGQAKRTFYKQTTKSKPELKNSLVLPYSEGLVNLAPALKNLNINLVFKNDNTVKSMLIKNSPSSVAGCVYSIPCNECACVYIGQTGKSLSSRLKQHSYAIRTAQQSSALYLHSSLCNHSIDFTGAKCIVKSKDFVERNVIESALIKHCNNSLNVSPGMYKLDPYLSLNIARQNNIAII